MAMTGSRYNDTSVQERLGENHGRGEEPMEPEATGRLMHSRLRLGC